MLIFSHRGYHINYKENTLEAFSSSLNYRIDGIETDVRITADDVPILFHNRLTPSYLSVSKLTHVELKNTVGFSVPTLNEALSKWNHIIWNIEIKTPDAVEKTLEVLHPYKHSHRFIVTSFFHDILSKIADKLNVECGAIIAHNPIDIHRFLLNLQKQSNRINTIVLPFEFLSMNAISIAHSLGFKLFIYDAETIEDIEKCRDQKVDAIITNRPDLIPI